MNEFDAEEAKQIVMANSDWWHKDDVVNALEERDQRIKQLESALRDMGESLKSIAFYDEPDAEKVLWWATREDKEKFPMTLALDTEIAREALSRNKELLEEINNQLNDTK